MSYHGEKVSNSLTPQAFNGGAFVAAQANAPATVADVVLLSTGERITQGHVVWRDHGLTVGSYYFLSQTAAGGFTATIPTVGLYQRLFFVLDANTILVDVQPAEVVNALGAAGVSYLKEMTASVVIVSWASPFTEAPLPELDVQVPAGSWLDAEYVLHASTSNTAWAPTGFKNRGYAAGDRMSGIIEWNNGGDTGANWYKSMFNETEFDNDPGTTRQFDAAMTPGAGNRIFMKVRYKNNGAAAKTFGWDFGCDINVAGANVNLTIAAGSTVRYTLF